MKTMKKALAVLLSVLMVFSIGVVAFAAEGEGEGEPAVVETTEGEGKTVSSDHLCPYCGEMHDDKDTMDSLTGFYHLILYVIEQFKSIFQVFSK
ncbi:MAG: hypothetical protein IK104_07785 [Clostridia bacterium]|nr:hypothetical protein [Clostridia bacterium]